MRQRTGRQGTMRVHTLGARDGGPRGGMASWIPPDGGPRAGSW